MDNRHEIIELLRWVVTACDKIECYSNSALHSCDPKTYKSGEAFYKIINQCGEITDKINEIIDVELSIDPVFKEYLKNVAEGGISAMTDAYSYNISISTLFKKLIEKVIMLEQTIEELKSK